MSEQRSEALIPSPSTEVVPELTAAVNEALAPFAHRVDILEKKMRSLEGDLQRLKNRPTTGS